MLTCERCNANVEDAMSIWRSCNARCSIQVVHANILRNAELVSVAYNLLLTRSPADRNHELSTAVVKQSLVAAKWPTGHAQQHWTLWNRRSDAAIAVFATQTPRHRPLTFTATTARPYSRLHDQQGETTLSVSWILLKLDQCSSYV